MKRPEETKRGLECIVKGKYPNAYCNCSYLNRPVENLWECSWAEINKDALAYIQQLEAQVPKWISVEERLPNRNEKVFVTDGVHTWDFGEFNGLAYGFAREGKANPHLWNWKGRTVRIVNWWMPKKTALPEPSKEG